MRRKLLLGNWKMNKTIAETKTFAKASLALSELATKHEIDLGVCPPYLSLVHLKDLNPNLIVASQNVHHLNNGAYTGEISIPMLKEIKINWSLVGHSERRTYYNETNESCNLKVIKLLENDMVPVYCVGETLEQFENGLTKEVIQEQVSVGLKGVTKEKALELVIAYEPVWSIGTGKNASVEIAQDICGYIRQLLVDLYDQEVADKVRILYGGSVKPENIRTYLSAKDIDGALVGGASLAIDSYENLVKNII